MSLYLYVDRVPPLDNMAANPVEGTLQHPKVTMEDAVKIFLWNIKLGKTKSLFHFRQQVQAEARGSLKRHNYQGTYRRLSILLHFDPEDRKIQAQMDRCLLKIIMEKHHRNDGFVAMQMFQFLSVEFRETVSAQRMYGEIIYRLPNGRFSEKKKMTDHQIQGLNAISRAMEIEFHQNNMTETPVYHDLVQDFCVLMSTAMFL